MANFLQNMPGLGGGGLPGPLGDIPGTPGNGLLNFLPGGGMPMPGGPNDPVAQLLAQLGISPDKLPLLQLVGGGGGGMPGGSPLGGLPGLSGILG